MGRIQLRNVQKDFGDVTVIPPLDLVIEDGEFAVFVGPSGCGKSTLLRLISGLEDTSAGTIEIDGIDATPLPPAKRGLAMVFQSYALYPHMSVRKNIAFPMKMAGVNEAEQKRRIDAAAKALNLTDYLDRKPGQLSGGQRQRVAIGRAIVREPAAFLFDEPLSNLDAALRVGMRLEISELHKRLKTTMIYVTHDQVEAMTMADKIAVLRDGRVEQFGTPLELFNHPANRFVAGFIGSPAMNFVQVNAQGGALQDGTGAALFDGVAANTNEGEAYELGVRPRDLIIDDQGPLQVTITEVEQLGTESYLFGEMTTGETLVIHMPGQTDVVKGAQVRLALRREAVHLFRKDNGLVVGL